MAISLGREKTQAAAKKYGETPGSLVKQFSAIRRRFIRPVKSGEMIFFTSQLSLMLEIGMPLLQALKAIESQTQNPNLKSVIRAMLLDIEEGHQLSDAMSRHPQIFDGIFISLVRSGETGGFLKKTLDGVVAMQEKRQALITQLRSTMTYPAVLSILAVAVVIFVLISILPKFAVLFEGKESIMPPTTRFLMAASASLRSYWWAYISLSVGFVIGLFVWKDSDWGKAFIDRFLVSTPFLARITNKIYTCQLLRTLGYLMESQVPLMQALQVTQLTFRNRYFTIFIQELIDNVEQGGRFSKPFAGNPYILESVKQMVATAEEVGNLPPVMLRLADFYDAEVDRDLKITASMIEPISLIILGGVVGLIVSSVILPMFKLATIVR